MMNYRSQQMVRTYATIIENPVSRSSHHRDVERVHQCPAGRDT